MKKEQMVIISNYANDINMHLNKGWVVVSVTPSHVGNNGFCFVLEREKQ